MNFFTALAGILPLLLFVIIDSFYGLKAGIITAAVAALAELALSLTLLGSVDALSIGNVFLVFVMGLAAWKMRQPMTLNLKVPLWGGKSLKVTGQVSGSTIFKLQPVILGLTLSGFFLISHAIGQPILTLLATKYQGHMPGPLSTALSNPVFVRLLNLTTAYAGWMLLLQALLVAWAAFKLNNWWWITFRGVGFYLALALAVLITKIHLQVNPGF